MAKSTPKSASPTPASPSPAPSPAAVATSRPIHVPITDTQSADKAIVEKGVKGAEGEGEPVTDLATRVDSTYRADLFNAAEAACKAEQEALIAGHAHDRRDIPLGALMEARDKYALALAHMRQIYLSFQQAKAEAPATGEGDAPATDHQ